MFQKNCPNICLLWTTLYLCYLRRQVAKLSHTLGVQTAPGGPGRGGGEEQRDCACCQQVSLGKGIRWKPEVSFMPKDRTSNYSLSASFLLLEANPLFSVSALNFPGPVASVPISMQYSASGKVCDVIFLRHHHIFFLQESNHQSAFQFPKMLLFFFHMLPRKDVLPRGLSGN